jgi:hypothetical protein
VCLRVHGAVAPAVWDRDQAGFQVLHVGLPAVAQHLIQFLPQQLQYAVHALSPVDRQPLVQRPPHADRSGPESQHFQHIAAAAHAGTQVDLKGPVATFRPWSHRR